MPSSLDTRTVSTWSLRRTLGNVVAPDSAVGGGPLMHLPALKRGLSLLELIPELKTHGYSALHLCHFHLESRDPAYLALVRRELAANDIHLEMLLIDDGDLMADDIDAHVAWYDEWLRIAATLGAQRARICAGRQAPTPERLQRSGELLATLAADHPEVRIVTENWMEAMPDAASVTAVLDAAGQDVGFLIDLGNWSAPEKYDHLAAVAGRAESCHAKCNCDDDGPDADDFTRCLTILKDVGYDGPLALIYDGPDDDEWAGLDREWEIVQRVFA